MKHLRRSFIGLLLFVLTPTSAVLGNTGVSSDPAALSSSVVSRSVIQGRQPIPLVAAPQAQTITFAQPAGVTFNQSPVQMIATATSGLAVTFTSSTPLICTTTTTGLVTLV
ncbi:MAG: hypothetical protein WCP88_05395, partial [bacterium]